MNMEALLSEILGERISDISTTVLKKGMANNGIFIHEIQAGPDSAGITINIVEKKTERSKDFKNASMISRMQRDDVTFTLFPRIYHVFKDRVSTSTFMEFVEGVNSRQLRKGSVAKEIAQAYFKMSQTKIDYKRKPGSQEMFVRRKTTMLQYLKDADLDTRFKAELPPFFEKFQRTVSSRPVCVCHRDAGFGNMALDQDRKTIRFIDFGSLDHDFIGADFVHLFRYAMENDYDLEGVVGHFSDLAGLDARDVIASAAFSAARRSAFRLARFRSEGMEKAFVDETQGFAMILERFEKL